MNASAFRDLWARVMFWKFSKLHEQWSSAVSYSDLPWPSGCKFLQLRGRNDPRASIGIGIGIAFCEHFALRTLYNNRRIVKANLLLLTGSIKNWSCDRPWIVSVLRDALFLRSPKDRELLGKVDMQGKKIRAYFFANERLCSYIKCTLVSPGH